MHTFRLASVMSLVCAYAFFSSGCKKSERWDPIVLDVGWSSASTPLILDFQPTGLDLCGRLFESLIEWCPSGGHWELLSDSQKASISTTVPFLDEVYSLRVLDGDTVLMAGKKGRDADHIIVGKYRVSLNSAYDVRTIGHVRKDVRQAILSDDLRYFAMATKSGIVVQETDTGKERTYLPEFRVADILFSNEGSRLAAHIRASEAARVNYEFLDHFKKVELVGNDPLYKPYYVGFVVLNLPTGVIEDIQPNDAAKYFDISFSDASYPSRFFMSQKSWPFYFQGSKLRANPSTLRTIAEGNRMIGPRLSPDENHLGFLLAAGRLEWTVLTTGKTRSVTIAPNQAL